MSRLRHKLTISLIMYQVLMYSSAYLSYKLAHFVTGKIIEINTEEDEDEHSN